MKKKDVDNSEEQNEGPFIYHRKKRKISLPKLKTFAALKNPVFRLYYGAHLAQSTMLQPIRRFCPECGMQLEVPGRFCQNCGTKQPTE